MNAPQLIPYGEAAMLIDYGQIGYDEKTVTHIQALADDLRQSGLWQDIVPAYTSLLVSYDPAALSFQTVTSKLESAIATMQIARSHTPAIIDIPVVYGGEDGPDMEEICRSSGLSEAGVIALHSREPYRVCMLGFIPGFAFLSEAPPDLHHDRRDTPRQNIPAGSVGIGGWQSGIYGLDSPGGWQIIGRALARMFDPERENPFYVSPGDYIRFVPVANDADDDEAGTPS